MEINWLKFCLSQKVEIYLSSNLGISLSLKTILKFKVLMPKKNVTF